MIPEDRELLRRMATVNRALGAVVTTMLARITNGQLPADDLHAVGVELVVLGADMIRHATATLHEPTLNEATLNETPNELEGPEWDTTDRKPPAPPP